MLGWATRDVLVDVSINAVPVVILAFFIAVMVVWFPFEAEPLTYAMTHVLTLIPIVVLVLATYYVARAIERDASERMS